MASLKLNGIIGKSPAFEKVCRIAEKVATSDSTVLITGETGTGKGLMARAIHDASRRAQKPFVAINCGAIPENLLESELFGHVRGAFTGATTSKCGKFEMADGGTIFLDEIGDMSPDLQVKILRVLEEGEFEPVGGNRTIKVGIRVLAATHRDLEKRVASGQFREDLYYRLFVIPLHMPPLRQRKTDVPLLISHFHSEVNSRNQLEVEGFSPNAVETLKRYHWPGNIRELKNLVERSVVLKQEGIVDVEDLPHRIRRTEPGAVATPNIEISEEGISLNTAVNDFEKALILQSLEKTKWVKNRAAKLLQLNRTTLVEKIKRHQLIPGDERLQACHK